LSSRRALWDLPAREFARRETADRLHRVLAELERISANPGEDEVHDLRVSIRRYNQAARIFRPLLAGAARKIAKRLSTLLETAAEVRDLDVGLVILAALGVPGDDPLAATMREQRRCCCLKLLGEVYLLRSEAPETTWPRKLEKALP
jgi:hypothetical protein